MISKVGHQRGGGLTNHHSIHAIGSGTKCTAKPGGAKFEFERKRIDKLRCRLGVARLRCREKIIYLLSGLWVGILFPPACNGVRELA